MQETDYHRCKSTTCRLSNQECAQHCRDVEHVKHATVLANISTCISISLPMFLHTQNVKPFCSFKHASYINKNKLTLQRWGHCLPLTDTPAVGLFTPPTPRYSLLLTRLGWPGGSGKRGSGRSTTEGSCKQARVTVGTMQKEKKRLRETVGGRVIEMVIRGERGQTRRD